jgi:hypothetical protein
MKTPLFSPMIGGVEGSLSEGNNDNNPDALAVDESSGGDGIIDTDNIFDSVNKGHADKFKSTTDDQPPKTDDDTQGETDPLNTDNQTPDNKSQTKDQTPKDEVPKDEVVDPKTQQQTTTQTKQRDYTKYTPEDVSFLKKLPNNTFNAVVPILDKLYAERRAKEETAGELKKLRENPNALPESWYEHEQGYTLSPEYQQANHYLERANIEANHWEQQLIAIRSKQPWSELQYDQRTNQYYIGQEHEFDESRSAVDEVRLTRKLQEAINYQGQFQSQVQQVAAGFKNYRANIDKQYMDFFDPLVAKLLPELKPKEEHMKVALASLHPMHKGTAAGQIIAQCYSIILNQGEMLMKYMQNKSVATKNANDAVRAGATTKGVGSTTTGGRRVNGGNGAPKEIDLDELESEYNS